MHRRPLFWVTAGIAIVATSLSLWAFRRSVGQRVEDVASGRRTSPTAAVVEGVDAGQERSFDPVEPGADEHVFADDVRALMVRPRETWIGTSAGLRVIGEHGERTYTARSGLLRNDVVALAEDGEQIVVAHGEGGLSLVRSGLVRTLALRSLVTTALAASDDGVWVGTVDSGLLLLQGGDLLRVPIEGGEEGAEWQLDGPRICGLAVDEAGAVWVATFDRGVAVRSEGSWRLIGVEQGLLDPFTTSIAAAGGRVAVGTQVGLTILGEDGAESFGLQQGLPHEHVSSVALADDDLFVGTFGGGLGLFEDGDWSRVDVPDLPSPHVQGVALDAGGALWVGTREGLAVRDSVGGGWRLLRGPAGPPGPRITAVSSAPQEGDPSLWVGTFERGVGRLLEGQWTSYGLDEGLPSLEINAITHHRGVVWVATNSGPAWFADGRFAAHPRLDQLAGLAVSTLLSDGDALWLGTARGVVRLGADGSVASLGVREGLVNGHVYALARQDATLWAGTLGGLSALRSDGRPDPLSTLTVVSGPAGISHNWVNALLATGDQLWVGTYGGGVDLHDRAGWRRVFPAGAETLEVNPAAAGWAGARPVFGTLDRGLLVLEPDGSSGRLLHREIGLGSPSVSAVHGTGDSLWIGTTAGLLRVDPSAVVR